MENVQGSQNKYEKALDNCFVFDPLSYIIMWRPYYSLLHIEVFFYNKTYSARDVHIRNVDRDVENPNIGENETI